MIASPACRRRERSLPLPGVPYPDRTSACKGYPASVSGERYSEIVIACGQVAQFVVSVRVRRGRVDRVWHVIFVPGTHGHAFDGNSRSRLAITGSPNAADAAVQAHGQRDFGAAFRVDTDGPQFRQWYVAFERCRNPILARRQLPEHATAGCIRRGRLPAAWTIDCDLHSGHAFHLVLAARKPQPSCIWIERGNTYFGDRRGLSKLVEVREVFGCPFDGPGRRADSGRKPFFPLVVYIHDILDTALKPVSAVSAAQSGRDDDFLLRWIEPGQNFCNLEANLAPGKGNWKRRCICRPAAGRRCCSLWRCRRDRNQRQTGIGNLLDGSGKDRTMSPGRLAGQCPCG